MVASRRLLAVVVLLSAAVVFPTLASAATADFRVLIDIDNDVATGCTEGGMAGVEQVLVTRVVTTGTTAQVTRMFRQVCTAGSFGAALDLDLTPRPAGFHAPSGSLLIESRIAFSALVPSGMPRNMRLGFDATDGFAVQRALTKPNGDPFLFPTTASRRRAVGDQGSRNFILDGLDPDWEGLNALANGIANSGSVAVRMLRVFAFANNSDHFIYFRFDGFIDDNGPFAQDDTYSRLPGQGLSVATPGVLANDGDPNGHPLTASPVSTPANGDVTLNPDGSFTYTPDDPTSPQSDSFKYKNSNGTQESNVAKVTIKVSSSPSQAPIATDDHYPAKEDTPLVIGAPGVLGNDIDPDGQPLTATLLAPPAHGGVVLNANGSFTYTPQTNFFGIDTFTYTVSDGSDTDTATVTITITSANDAPVAGNVSRTTNEEVPVSVTLVGSDQEGGTLTYNVGSPSNGVLSGVAPNLTYTPNPNFFGVDTFTYTVSDGSATSNTATVTITVNPVNDAPSFSCGPTVTADSSAGAASFAGWATGILAGPANESSQTLTFEVTANNNPGLFSVQPAVSSNGTLTFTPVANASGSASVTIRLRDNGGTANGGVDVSGSCSFTINVDAPPAVSTTTPANGATGVAANANATINFSESVNATGSSFTMSCATSGAHTFTTSASPSASFTLNPDTDFTQGELCTVTVLAAGVTDVDTFDPPDNMTANYVFSFTVDAAPSVSSTTPANGATNVGAATNVAINFSESVNATGASFTISCATSGAHTFTTSASPSATFTLNPDTDFTQGETCTVTVLAAGVTDADANDPPDNMLANYVFSFTVDAAPSVTAVTPLNGATNVANNTNLTVTFSEPVTITNSSVTISCANTGAHTVAVSGGPTTWTVDPTVDFGNGELCTATVVAAQVSDNDANDPPDGMLANFVWSFTTDTPPSVTATTPVNASTSSPDTNITVTFDEAVNASASSFTISCTTSGAHTFNLSGGPTTFTLDPNTDFTGGETCTVTVVAAQVTDQDAGDPPDNMAANYVFSFGVDAAPTVTSTTPTNGAPQVAANANVVVNFSESVNASGASFDINCATSGAHTFSTSASPSATFTLDPTADFTQGETCTATVFAAGVTDVDAFDPPDNMAANYVFSFTVDAAPSVSSTTPANGATDVGGATNVTINFSESVNATVASFDITCGTSGTHTFTTSATPSATFTLDPTTDFTAGETCTVTAFAAGITDADAFDPPDNMLANYVFSFTIDVAPSVSAVTPLDTAVNVATNTNLTVTFSEAVTITNSSVTISCANTGAHTVAVSGGPTVWTVDPTTDFGNNELCTATVLAAQVSDNDGNDPPDNMAANFVWTFTTDNPPSVSATTPVDTSTTSPDASITVTFDEAVNASGTSFTISCGTSGAHTFALSGGPTTWTLNPDTDFTGGETCTVTVVAANVTDADAGDPPDNMTANYVFTFGIDAAPAVTSTTPTNGAPQTAADTNVVINFNESVNATGASFTVSCGVSGAHTFTTSASPSASFTLNPDTDFTAGELCTVTVVAANVTDADAFDPPDNMAADYVFTFTVDQPPSVSSTTPLNGATDIGGATNITVNFDESVNATGTSFTISCANSGVHTFALSTSPSASFTINPDTDFTSGELCTVTVVAANVTDADSFDPPDNMVANYVFSFTIDVAPSVSAVTPLDTATNVATNTNLSVTFNEAVTITNSSVTISCANTGAHTVAVSGGPTVWTVDPTVDFGNGELCTATVLAAQVSDNDGNDPPDNMAANFVWTFTTDNPPGVSATTPVNSSVSFPATNITVTFDESVNASGSSFTISCTSSGAHTFALSGGPTTWTLNPDTDFTGGETCTVTVVAAQVTDTDAGDPPDNMVSDYVFSFGIDSAPTVLSTSPTNSLTPDQASNINIVITYSEPVTAGGTAYTIICTNPIPPPFPSNRPFVLSGNGTAVHTLDPNTNLPAGKDCTVTILASQITDVDAFDPPDNMAADYTFAFHVDANPQIVSTSPVDGSTISTNTNIGITWTEPVNMTTVNINCTLSGSHTSVLSTSDNITWTVNPDTDFTQGETCTIQVLSASVTDVDSADPPDNPGPDISWQYTVDTAPTVTTTTPADLAIQQANNTDIVVNFSESVVATASSFTVSCATSGAHTFALTSSPASSYTLNPDTDFTNGELCTVTVVAANIADNDSADPPDNMAANYVFTFTIDNPPAVTATTPTNAQVISPSTAITVTFNESVNATTNSFTVNCGGNQTYTLSASPSTSFTLTPTTSWPAGACTLTVIAAQITDADSGDPPDNPIADTVVNFTVNTPPVAKDDVEIALGNLTMTVSDANGVIQDGGNDDDDGVGGNNGTDGQDTDPDAGAVIKIQNPGTQLTGSAGGKLDWNPSADGGYTYHSEAGDQNVDDVFTYTIVDNNGATDTGQLTIHVGPRYLFVDAAFAGAPKDGRDTNPFQTLQQAEAGSAVNDTFVVRQGAYTDFITLKNGQVMYGSGASAALTFTYLGKLFTVFTPTGTHPSFKRSTAGNTITLASGNNLRGIDVSASSGGAAIAGTGFGTLTVSESRIGVGTTNTGGALVLNNGTLAATFQTVNSTASVNGISLTTVGGAMTISGGALSGATGSTFTVSGGSANITMGASITQANAADVVTIASTNTGVINFNANVQSSGTSTGVNISGSSGTYNFNGAANTLAGSGGAVTIAGESGTILFSAGTAITNAATSFKLSGTSTANITYHGTIANTANGGIVFDINNSTAGAYSTGTITFDGTSVSGSAAGANGVLSVINNMTGTLSVSNFSETANNNTYANTLLLIGGTNTGGSFTFNNLDLQATGNNHDGKGLVMSGGGTLNLVTGAGTNTIDVGNTALSLNGVALGASAIATLNSLGDPLASAVILTAVSGGTLTIGSGTITCNTAACFVVTNGNANVTYNGTLTQASAFNVVSITGHSGGTYTFGGNITASVNDADLFFDNADGTYNFNATNAFTTGAGINITNGSGGTFSFSTNTSVTNGLVDATDNACFRVDASAPNVTYSGNLTKNAAVTGRLVDIQGQSGGTITFQTGTLSATSTSGTSTGIGLDNADGTVNFNGTTTLNGGNAGVDILAGSSGTFSFTSGTAITNPTGHAFAIGASAPNVTYAGTITQNTAAQRAIDITGYTGGTSTFSGNIGSNGGAGISIVGTGGTVSISGQITLNNTGATYIASGPGVTVNVTNTNNTIGATNAATGPAVNISTTIGTVEFKSVAVNGGANAISLTNTGAGTFKVAGDGTLARNGSGGTLTNTTSDCVVLSTASNVTLQSMNLTSCGDTNPTAAEMENTTGEHAVQMQNGSNLILSGLLVQSPSASGLLMLDVGGTNRVNSNSLFDAFTATSGHGMYIYNNGVNMTLMQLNGITMQDNSTTASNVFLANGGTANMQFDVIGGCVFQDLGVQAITAAAGGVALATGTLTTNIIGNTFQNAKGVGDNNVGILVQNGASHVAVVQTNTFSNIAEDGSIANTSVLRTQNNGGTMNATLKSNTFQNIAYAAGGRHMIGHIYEPASFVAGSSTLDIDGNIANTGITFTATNREFVFIDFRDNARGGSVKIRNNNVSMGSAGGQQLVEVRSRQLNASTVNLSITGNIMSGNSTGLPFIDIDAEALATVNATISGSNTFTNAGGATTISAETEAAGSTMCFNATGNTLNAGAGTIGVAESAGTLNVTQTSAANLAAVNGIPAGNVTVSGAPTFNQPACTLP